MYKDQVTHYHLNLLNALHWTQGSLSCSPAIDDKRPFGSSNIQEDLEHLLPELNQEERNQVFEDLVEVIYIIVNLAEKHISYEYQNE